MIAGIESNKNINPIITELYIRGRNLNICLLFFTQSDFMVPQNRLRKIRNMSNKKELQQ